MRLFEVVKPLNDSKSEGVDYFAVRVKFKVS